MWVLPSCQSSAPPSFLFSSHLLQARKPDRPVCYQSKSKQALSKGLGGLRGVNTKAGAQSLLISKLRSQPGLDKQAAGSVAFHSLTCHLAPTYLGPFQSRRKSTKTSPSREAEAQRDSSAVRRPKLELGLGWSRRRQLGRKGRNSQEGRWEPLSPVQSRGARTSRKGAQGSHKAFWETYIFLRAVEGNPQRV